MQIPQELGELDPKMLDLWAHLIVYTALQKKYDSYASENIHISQMRWKRGVVVDLRVVESESVLSW